LPVLHGLYWLTSNACRRPTALLVDDLHWADAASMRYLSYLLPRLEDLPLLVVAGVRAGVRETDDGLLPGLLAEATVVRPGPLGEAAVARLLAASLSGTVDAEFATACWRLTVGNPLLLHALVAAIGGADLAPTAANTDRLDALGPPAVARWVGVLVGRLAPETRSVARAVAVLGPRAPLAAVTGLAGVDAFAAADAVAEATRLGLLESEGDAVGFVHPLVASAVYEDLGGGERALAHRRAADVLVALGAEPERSAAHLLKTVPGTDGAVPLLRRAAAAALSRGSPEAALEFLSRCLAENVDADERLTIVRQAADVAMQVDLREAARLLESARTLAGGAGGGGGADGADISARLGVAYGYLLDPDRAFRALRDALDRMPPGDSDERRRLEAVLLVGPVVVPGRRDIVARAGELADLPAADGLGARMLSAALACHEMARCDPAGAARAGAALADGTLVRLANGEGPLVCGWITLLAADDPAALRSLDAAFDQAHRNGSLRALAPVYTFRALGRLWTGQLRDAEADAREALRLVETGRVDMDPLFAGAYLADALIEQGRLDEAAAVLARIGVPADSSPARPSYYALDAYARLARLTSDPDAVAAALAAGRAWAAYGFDNPAVGGWRTEAALALFAAGDAEGALRTARAELALAERWGAPRALGRALRVVGQLTGGTDGLELLRRSVDVLAGGPARLEEARSLAELGAALRRAGRRQEAREPLARALDAAEVCGATELARGVGTELRAAGFRPRRSRLVGVEALTPSEARVAELAAGGASNREIAQALFVTTKTVEVHLTSAYRKLGARRRTDLVRLLG
jgi:DNA-binding CsgD family transcriptional regulator/tetratricopeptide (TPR) repeat protein